MERGYSLPELIIVILVTGILCAIALPRLGTWLDRIAVEQASHEVVLILDVARNRATSLGAKSRVALSADTIVVDTLGPGGWGRWSTHLGPAQHGVSLAASNTRIVFGGNGIAVGLSNSRIVLTRGFHSETTTISRLGRVKR